MNRMRAPADVPPQERASNPETSAWVSANAGSGKTHVLVNRAIRLMLAGTLPQRILCLTYTVAAATEMNRRLFDHLGRWIAFDDKALAHHIRTLAGDSDVALDLDQARRLFARALDTPGGLKIQTIHAFCEQLLQRFPVEAGVVPGFRVLEDRQALDFIADSRHSVLLDGGTVPDRLAEIVAHAGEGPFDALIGELVRRRPPFLALEVAEHRRALLARVMQLTHGGTATDLASDVLASLDSDAYVEVANRLGTCGVRAGELARSIGDCLASRSPEDAFGALRSVFLTDAGEPRSETRFIPARLRDGHPGSAAFLLAEQDRLLPLFKAYDATRIVDLTGALCDIGGRIVAHYERRKQAAGAYDYDDLIRRTLRMFSSLNSGWVLYKLDGGIDHVLLDEAQDTSRDQWSIVQSLSEEFYAGRGVRPELLRTIFAVGDEKQSIFGFQGASPEVFRAMGRHYGQRSREAGLAFEEVELNVSFRSSQAVLDMVDAVFPGGSHFARRRNVAGRVELWPLETMESQAERDPWRAPTGYALRDRPRRRLAARIAATIRGWIDAQELLPSEGRPIRPSDIMILVRNRTTLMDELVRALKTAGLPVAGADRLALTSHIAVMDLMALGRAALLPADDQMLACVLKGALLARDDDLPIDDDDLFALCHGRGAATLWDRLAAAVAAGRPFAKALSLLRAWRDEALNRPPFEFYMSVLDTPGVHGRLLARLGGEAEEPIDAFLTQCLDYDRAHSPSLEGFLHWLDGEQAMIKRDMDHGLGEIRVMTVHGAKGLESNVVILPDTLSLPDRAKDPGILMCEADVNGQRVEVPVWRVKDGKDHPVVEGLRDRLRDAALLEHDRLLYVAMTRARDRLYVCGHPDRAGSRELGAQCWYARIETAVKSHGRSVTDAEGRTVWRYESAADAPAAIAMPAVAGEPPAPAAALPLWVLAPAPPEPGARSWQSAARLTEPGGERITPPLDGRDPRRYRRGILIHRLLQVLPGLAPATREPAGRRFLSQPGHELGSAEQREILASVMRLLSDSRFAAVFGEGSLAEVPFAAEVEGTAVTGRIDRLVVTQSEILILDYKTNRPPPAAIADADPDYIRQLALYRRALLAIFPRRRIRTGLLWTEAPSLMEIPAAMLDGKNPSENQMELPLTD